MSRLRSARGCLAAHLSCCQPTLAACPNLPVGSGAGVADGPSGTVTRVLTGQAGAGAARRRRRTGSSTGVRGAILGQVQRDVAAALPGEGSATSIRSRRMWRHGPWRLGRPARPGGLCLITAQTSQATLARKNPPAGGRAARRSHRRRFDDRLMAVLAFGLDRLERRIGEDRVVAPDGKQLGLPGCCPLIQVADRRTISRQ
jgi:hypothetical protein